ncbi:hypothetical protein H2200_001070 [Cladophialophora chaetospira]|uniref:NTF2-like domain-containing protein n=1 Tax=Cladophialophora chaetospira TaxID=386627 RepID=A0AA39CNP5_9EURO|nr:hypothetical protein H2200_001070 [Cladophialophora chaetospira]
MRSFTIISTLLIALLPIVSAWSCLSDSDAQYVVDQSIVVIKHPDVDAARQAGLALYAPNVIVNGDSINVLNDVPLGTTVYSNITAYLDDTLSIQGPSEVNVIAIVHDCSSLVWFWEFIGVGGPTAARVRGMTYTQVNADKQVISENVEFNSLTWAENLGFTVTPPAGGEKVKREWKA